MPIRPRGEVKSPVVLVGALLVGRWDNASERRLNVWNVDDLRDNDRTHPSESGRKKVAEMLLDFCHSDPMPRVGI